MTTLETQPRLHVPPVVTFCEKTGGAFIQFGSEWRRMTAEDEAKFATGYSRETREPHVGVYITRRANGLMRVGFDLWRLDVNLRPEVIERLDQRWRQEAAKLSKSMQRSIGRRTHFSKSFARFEVAPECVEGWKAELECALSNPASFERLERGTVGDDAKPQRNEQL